MILSKDDGNYELAKVMIEYNVQNEMFNIQDLVEIQEKTWWVDLNKEKRVSLNLVINDSMLKLINK